VETLKDRATSAAGRLGAFRAADAFAQEAFRAARGLSRREGEDLAREIRRTAALSVGAVVAAGAVPAGGARARELLQTARSGLIEGRYYLYLARRLGLLDLRRYRAVATRQDAALREVETAFAHSAGQPVPP